MIKKVLAGMLLLLGGLPNHAQQEFQCCGTQPRPDAWENEFQTLIAEYKASQNSKTPFSIPYTIPIIFHVVHSGQPIGTFPNISAGQIQAQIEVLNQDFSGHGLNASNYPPNAFVNWAINQSLPSAHLDSNGRVKIADVGIQFCLATKDTSGLALAEPGINRINIDSMNLSNPSSYSTPATMRAYLDNTLKPQTIWDVTKYLNVWISDKNNALSYTGVATGPPLSGLIDLPNTTTALTDGIWCFAKTIGSNLLFPTGVYGSSMVAGRTLTHEVGHYLGLRHIWGDGACATDYCDDTPAAAAQNVGAPSYPLNVGSCSNPSNAPEGEMFMNFMDYPWDPYKYMFTYDQTARMRTAMINSPFRNQLGTHTLCLDPLGHVDSNIFVSIFPNPATTELNLNLPYSNENDLSICNLLGQVLITAKNKSRIDIAHLTNGIYILTVIQGQNMYTKKFIKD